MQITEKMEHYLYLAHKEGYENESRAQSGWPIALKWLRRGQGQTDVLLRALELATEDEGKRG